MSTSIGSLLDRIGAEALLRKREGEPASRPRYAMPVPARVEEIPITDMTTESGVPLSSISGDAMGGTRPRYAMPIPAPAGTPAVQAAQPTQPDGARRYKMPVPPFDTSATRVREVAPPDQLTRDSDELADIERQPPGYYDEKSGRMKRHTPRMLAALESAGVAALRASPAPALAVLLAGLPRALSGGQWTPELSTGDGSRANFSMPRGALSEMPRS